MLVDGNMNIGDVRILDIGNKYGIMASSADAFPKKFVMDKRNVTFMKNRCNLAFGKGIDPKKMYRATQEKRNGSYCVLTKELIDSKEDGWLLNIPEDILIVTKDNPGVVIGHSCIDFPVVIMTDIKLGVTAVCHCDPSCINGKMPLKMYDALKKEFDSDISDIGVYVGSCISEKKEAQYPNYILDDEIWKDSVLEKRDYYSIDLRKAISNQLNSLGIDDSHIFWNMDDTLTNPNYYSAGDKFGGRKKIGRNFVGAYYEDSVLVKVKK